MKGLSNMKDVNYLLKIISNYNLKACIGKFLNKDCVHIVKGKIEADVMYSAAYHHSFNEGLEEEIAISYSNKKELSGGMYGIALKGNTEEDIIKEMMMYVFKETPKKKAPVQLSLFDLI
jgi:hypothetical protein